MTNSATLECVTGTTLYAVPPQISSVCHQGDARDLAFLADTSIDLIVTSPPYWLRRDYGHPDQLGQEATPQAYIEALLGIMSVWVRLLRPHASVFLNIGDTYQDGFLAGIPARFELAARDAGWHVVNHIVWAKAVGRPEPVAYRLSSRHEAIFHLTRAKHAADVFFDRYALACDRAKAANPGDVWASTFTEESDDLWELHPTRSKSGHLAPFPPELARRAILLACPEHICTVCGAPHTRRLEPSADLDPTRPQAKRAMELFQQHGLTEEHLAAIRAVGISDAGKAKVIQKGSGRNTAQVQRLAAEAKAALKGYFREFTFAPKRMVGWNACGCGVPSQPGMVLDPFMGSGTTLNVARELGRRSIGVDLVLPDTQQKAD
ncbi:MAG: site-specific DNA-methyltransferase [Candidatus Viridilinea halotolerans]|uniref:Methyltransferase n=1 Tax=Candidatus Viridilinea halotolerans TaxID=2491704 RepID=A0A426U196_9CHLR|nr:MAG: site-specific DNA-methyltransferase [Candidatus Viridilinea halotolerans]